MVDIPRLKLLDAIVFFVENTRHCGAVKLFKLLYFLDMLHFRETGRSVTGLQYTALPYGPLPTDLYDEMSSPKEDLAGTITIKAPPEGKNKEQAPTRTVITPIAPWRDRYLSVREKRIATELAEIFRDANADEMSKVSHAAGGPWEKAKNKSPGKWVQVSDYLDALSPTLKMGSGKALNRELLKVRVQEFKDASEIFH